MSNQYNKHLQKGLIITDDIAINPILDFNLYRDAIVNIVKQSFPNFTIGIFGDWGTGKTTLLNSIDKELQKDKDLVIVRFESWRYEREEQFALIPLLKTIAFALPNEKEFYNLKRKLKRSAINFVKKTPDILSSIISKYVTDDIAKFSKAAFDSLKKEFDSKLELLTEIDKDTLYFDGFEDIKQEIQRIYQINPNFKIVVFIDDLDRCSPIKTLEVLESIKVFLGMDGFIYILGLSHDIVSKLIDIEYEKSGIKGEQYIKKMIQIPITLPKWNKNDIIDLVKDLIKKGIIHDKYKDIVDENIDLISIAIENNPREIKRFLNSFIVGHEIFSSIKNFKPKELMIMQAIQLRWNSFYNILLKADNELLEELPKYILANEEERMAILDLEMKANNNFDQRIRKILHIFRSDSELWEFLIKNSNTILNIKDFGIYRRATQLNIELTPRQNNAVENASELLRSENIKEFNRRRKENEYQGLELKGINLFKADLREANFVNIIFKNANLSEANLTGADLTNARLREATLIESVLNDAKLNSASLVHTKLNRISILRADLSKTIIIHPINYEEIKLDKDTVFHDSVIDKPKLLEYISNKTSYIPKQKLENKRQLREKLEQLNIVRWKIDVYLSYSDLPD